MTLWQSSLLVWLGMVALSPASDAQEAADGERLLQQRCGSCHSMEAGQNRIGPSLAGIFGQPAGRVEGARYSAALRGSNLVWDEQTLDRFLANPRETVQGTTMTIGLANAEERRLVIAYLKARAAR
jgi:cytochrome c